MSYKKSNVAGGSWSTPFNTPFFIRYGESSIKVPMARLRAEYEAWEKFSCSFLADDSELHTDDPFASTGPLDWAEDVEQELFSGGSDSDGGNTKSNTDRVDPTIVNQVVADGTVTDGAGYTLYTIPEVDEEGGAMIASEVLPPSSTDPADSTPSTTPTNSTMATSIAPTSPVYRVVNVAAGNDVSFHMVEEDSNSGSDAGDSTATANDLFEAIQFLGTVGLLNLDTYATVFDTAARVCASGHPFWFNDPTCTTVVV